MKKILIYLVLGIFLITGGVYNLDQSKEKSNHHASVSVVTPEANEDDLPFEH
ncbi:hypothetical protein [Fictibacillus sp. 26RED30]|uniref:hypothetical protein n=1 Tax=Fictibacillus sp. 26RED30 TaxID=2745877 RepID=UPI0018CF81DF|nr:hypothetical protein [Fictibacillus sp. 26RED30]MBH0161836.1 hypothetical protein [Fictibacillus sp. 26RED30]